MHDDHALGFTALLGIAPTVTKPGHSQVEVSLKPHHLNRAGSVHGGLMMSVLDTLMGYAAHSVLTDGPQTIATSRMTTHFLEALSGGTLKGEGRVTGENAGYVLTEGALYDADGRLIGTAQGQFSKVSPQ